MQCSGNPPFGHPQSGLSGRRPRHRGATAAACGRVVHNSAHARATRPVMIALRHGQPALVLAPMEGVTDAPMRALMAETGAFAFCVAEFLRVSQVVPPARIILRHVPELDYGARTACGLPVQVQLLGGDPERLAQAAQVAVAAHATAIDLNFGCPARTVNRHDGGATLLQYPQRIRTIVHTVRQALPAHIPVSAKMRLGWDNPHAIVANAEMAALGGAAWITIHGRTRAQGYKPPAFWHPIGEIRQQLAIPVVANGDIWTVDDLRRCQDATGCEHFMLGRGAVADPTLPQRAAQALGILPTALLPPVAWPTLLQRFVTLATHQSQRADHLPGRIKQWAKMSHQRFPNTWYDQIKCLQSTQAILATLHAQCRESSSA